MPVGSAVAEEKGAAALLDDPEVGELTEPVSKSIAVLNKARAAFKKAILNSPSVKKVVKSFESTKIYMAAYAFDGGHTIGCRTPKAVKPMENHHLRERIRDTI